MILLPSSRRLQVSLFLVTLLALLVFLHQGTMSHLSLSEHIARLTGNQQYHGTLEGGLEKDDRQIKSRVERMRGFCKREKGFEKEFGRTNIRLSRSYEGSHWRTRLLLQKILRGEPITISAIGGSVTKGHHVQESETWFHQFREWMNDYVGDVEIIEINGAIPASGSDYFSFCFPFHIPHTSDLIFVELGINDEGIPEHVENMENLLRGLLDLPRQPAVILVEALAFSNGGMGGGGGRMHLPVAQYYDVPVINQRLPIANHFARHPQLVRHYFSQDYWGNPDTRHINARGHRDLGMLVASFVKDVTCEMLSEPTFSVQPHPSFDMLMSIASAQPPQTTDVGMAYVYDKLFLSEQQTWPDQCRVWRTEPAEGKQVGELMPGMWMAPIDYGLLPRMRVLEGWNPDTAHVVPSFHPTCFTTRTNEPSFNLTPSYNEGWEYWAHPERLDKPYLVAREPGAKVGFQMETNAGAIKMYALKSKTFGLGTVECWVDEEKEKSVKVAGWWDNGDANIGRFASLRHDLLPGIHTVHCELLQETLDPGGGHEFRIISMMSV
ncbi:hypothetical protein L204_104063 [Cryptococcus depauperatus]